MNTKMKKIAYTAIAALMLLSCSNDDSTPTPIESPAVAQTSATVRTLSFQWDAVDGAMQYLYRLTDANGEEVTADVTSDTSCTIEDLDIDTEYTLSVQAYSVIGSGQSNSNATTITARTNAQQRLTQPEVQVDESTFPVSISWQAVEDAVAYTWKCTNLGGTTVAEKKETTQTSAALPGDLAEGEYQFTITALADASQEELIDSDPVTVQFFQQGLPIYDATLVSGLTSETYTDLQLTDNMNGTYTLTGYYGVDLTFKVSTTGKLTFTSGGTLSGTTYSIKTNLTGANATVRINTSTSSADIDACTITLKLIGPGTPEDTITW